jgi:hypothetical protein
MCLTLSCHSFPSLLLSLLLCCTDDDEEEEDDEDAGSRAAGTGGKGVTSVAAPTKEEVYKAMHKVKGGGGES